MPTGMRWMIFHFSVIASIKFRAWIPEQVKWVTQVTIFNREKGAFVMGTRRWGPMSFRTHWEGGSYSAEERKPGEIV
jgi:hypothetical protein